MRQARENEQRLEAQLDRWLCCSKVLACSYQSTFLRVQQAQILTQLCCSEMFAAESKQASTLATLADKARALEAVEAKVQCV